MRLLRRLVLALVLLIPFLPATSMGDQLLVPLDKKVPAGTTTIEYGGQNLRFTTPAALLVKCEQQVDLKIKVTVSLYPGTSYTTDGTAAQMMTIYWVNFGTDVYDGGVPIATPWVGTFDTEGGFVDR